MVMRVPNSIAWPCKKLVPCKSKKRRTKQVIKSVLKRRNKMISRSVEAFVEIDLTSQGKHGSILNSKETNTPKHRTLEDYLKNSNLKMNDSENMDRKELFLWDEESGFIIKYPLYKESQDDYFRSLVPSNIKSKKEDDDVETDEKTIEWSLDVVEKYLSTALNLVKSQRIKN